MKETKEQRNQENWFFLSYVASGLDFFSRFGVHLTLIVRWDLEPFEPRFPSCDLGDGNCRSIEKHFSLFFLSIKSIKTD